MVNVQTLKNFKLSHLFTPVLVVVGLCLIYVAAVLINSAGDPFAFVLLGTRFSEGIVDGTEGYDGQFAYQIALNPQEAAAYLDVPAYRFQRILYPMAARLLALAQPDFIPWSLLLVNIIAIGFGTWATAELLTQHRVSRWYSLVYGLYAGQLVSLRTDLNEPLAQALVQGAILAWSKERRLLTIVAFALAALTKETTLIFLAAFMIYTLWCRDWRGTIGLGFSIVPFLLYQVFLWRWLGSFGVGSGGAGATSFSPVPLGGWLEMAQVSVAAFLAISLIVFPLSIFPSIAGVFFSVRSFRRGLVHPYVLMLLLNSLVILFLPNSTVREPVAMLRLTQGLVVSMLLYGALIRSWRILNYSFLWLVPNILLLGGVAESR